MDIFICLRIIEEFTAPQALEYFKKELEKYCQTPYMELVAGSHAFYNRIERVRKRAYEGQNIKFNHRTETRFLVMQYAYAGAMELNDPSDPLPYEEVLVQFINAYNELKKRRNESKKEAIVFPLEDEKLLFIVDQSTPDYRSPEDVVEKGLSDECQQKLRKLNELDLAIVEALRDNVYELSHKALAEKLGIDPTYFCKRLKKVRELFADLL